MREVYRKYRGYIRLFFIFALIVFALVRIDDALRLLGVATGILSPLVAGGCVAFVLNLPLKWLERGYDRLFKKPFARRIKRTVCLIVVFLFGLLVAFVTIYMLVPELGRAITIVVNYVPGAMKEARGWIEALNIDWLNSLIPQTEEASLSAEEIQTWISDAGQFLLSGFVSSGSVISGLAQSVWGGFLSLLFALYMLSGKEKIVSQAHRMISAYLPKARAESFTALARQTGEAFSGFISGQFISAIIFGLIVLVFMLAASMPYAPLISLLSAMFSLIPIFGAFIGCVLGALILLMASPVQAFWFFVAHVVIQQVSGNLIYPRVVGKSIGLPPLYMLAASTVGGSLMGIVGMLLFVPAMAVIYARLRESVNRRNTQVQPT